MTVAVQEAFIADLRAITALTTLVENRIYPLAVPSGAGLPAIQYRFSDGYPEAFYRNSFGLNLYQLQLDVYAESYRVNQTMVDLITSRYNGFQGALGTSNIIIQRASLTNVLNTIDTSSGEVFRTVIELDFMI